MPIYGRRQSKPNPGVGIDWGHRLSQGLAQCWPFNEGQPRSAIDVVGGGSVTLGSAAANITASSGPDGLAYACSGGSNAYLQATRKRDPANSFTIIARIFQTNSSSYQTVYVNPAGSVGYFIVSGQPTWYVAGPYGGTSNISLNTWHTIAVTYNHATTSGTHYLDGAPNGTWSASTPWPNTISRLFTDDAAETLVGSLSLLAVWDRVLSGAEVRDFTPNPWQIFAPPQSYFFLKPTVGGTTVSGAMSVTLAGDAFAGSGGLIGSGSMGVTLAPDVFSGVGSIAGSAVGAMAVTLTQDVFTGAGALASSGSMGITLAPDVFAGSGLSVAPGSGVMMVTLAPSTFAGVGTFTPLQAPTPNFPDPDLAGVIVATASAGIDPDTAKLITY